MTVSDLLLEQSGNKPDNAIKLVTNACGLINVTNVTEYEQRSTLNNVRFEEENIHLDYRVYKKKLNKSEHALPLCKAPQCTKVFD